MSETSGVYSVLLKSAGRLESIARDVESADAGLPIFCGVAANRLLALVGEAARELPQVCDRPRAIARLLDSVAAELSGLDPDPLVDEVLSLIGAARCQQEEA